MVAIERLGFVLAVASSREEKPNAAMHGAAIRSRNDCSFRQASTKSSGPPSARKASITAYRTFATTSACTTDPFPSICKTRDIRVAASGIPNRLLRTGLFTTGGRAGANPLEQRSTNLFPTLGRQLNVPTDWQAQSHCSGTSGTGGIEPVSGRKALHESGDRHWTECPKNDTYAQ